MTLLEKIKDANELTAKLKAQYPEITHVWFAFTDIPVSEVQARAEQIKGVADLDTVFRDEKHVLQLNCNTYKDGDATIFCYSKPIKVIKPKYIAEEELA